MSSLRKRYNTDQNLEEEGVWVDFGDGLKVRVRRINSKHSKEVRRKLEKPYTAQFRAREMPDSLQEKLLNQQISKSLIVEWEGVENPYVEVAEGQPVPMLDCTEENVLKLMSDPEFKDFREDILTASMTRETFEKAAQKEAEKNSTSVSSGS